MFKRNIDFRMDECLKRIETQSAGNEKVTEREREREKKEGKKIKTKLALTRNLKVNSRFFGEFAIEFFVFFRKARATPLIHYRITKF